MKTLVSKLQLSYYERGEFSDSRERTFEETIELLNHFKWREHDGWIVVGLNGPSVTIENGAGQYLKVGLYYYGKFSIYWLNADNKLFLKIVDDLANLKPYVEAFFNGTLSSGEFKKYHEWIWRKQRYFATQPFEYRFRASRFFNIMFLPCLASVIWTIAILAGIGGKEVHWGATAFIICIYIILTGANWFLFFNYYFYSRRHKLIISRGTDEFSFVDKGITRHYSKKDIKNIRIIENTRPKNLVSEFCVYEIYFRDGSVLKFTNFLMGRFTFDYKFPECKSASRHRIIPRV